MSRCWCFLSVFVGLLAMWAAYNYLSDSTELRLTRFGSFAPARNGCEAKWFVDGQSYMSSVADAIEAASSEIFITDWQLSPHIFLKRPHTGVNSLKWRLDKLLLRKAINESVKIYILLYSESKYIAQMDHESDLVLSVLKHDNIHVYLHPDKYTAIEHNFKGTGWWSHHEKLVVVDRSVAFVGGIDLCYGRWDTNDHNLIDDYPVHPCATDVGECVRTEGRYSRWIGKDYVNTFYSGEGTSVLDRSSTPRMPWHDVACSFTGPAVWDVAEHFIQRYNSLQPWWKFWNKLPQLHRGNEESLEKKHKIVDPSAQNLRIQVLRSVDKWSAGQPHEASIHSGYLSAIANAEHFIYIENQFFISSQPGFFLKVENQILTALADRIVRAYQNNEDFHVMIVMPLKPEFPGEWCTPSGKHLQSVSYWNYLTIYSGKDSLYSRLEHGNVPQMDIPRFLTVYGLRNYAVVNGKPVTEIVYVHSKLMIVDDKVALIGSANINDRSMLGSRDSEVTVMLEDVDMITGSINGQPYPVGKFSHTLRCHLMREHLGMLQDTDYEMSSIRVEDPLADNVLTAIWNIAVNNAVLYERVFCGQIEPTNTAMNCDQLKEWKMVVGIAENNPEWAVQMLNDEIQGMLVIFPVLFLKDVLKPSYLDVFGMYVDTRGQRFNLNFDEPGTPVFV